MTDLRPLFDHTDHDGHGTLTYEDSVHSLSLSSRFFVTELESRNRANQLLAMRAALKEVSEALPAIDAKVTGEWDALPGEHRLIVDSLKAVSDWMGERLEQLAKEEKDGKS